MNALRSRPKPRPGDAVRLHWTDHPWDGLPAIVDLIYPDGRVGCRVQAPPEGPYFVALPARRWRPAP